MSDIGHVNTGVPQGSILGPSLFLVYINDVVTFLGAQTILCADDTTILVQSSNMVDLYAKGNAVLSKLHVWLSYNKLLANPTKSSHIIFKPSQSHVRSYDLNLYLGPNIIPQSSSVKLLGITFDTHLSWHDHIPQVRKKVYSGTYAIAKLRFLFPLSVLRTIYMTFVQSHITYGIECYALTYHSAIKPIYIAQNKALRAMLSLPKRNSTSICV